VCTYVAIAIYSAAMTVISSSNVRIADWIKRHACGLDQASRLRIACRGNGAASEKDFTVRLLLPL
ncbi:MAG: hypothetical protein II517_04635, partial [Ruminococcus sp.]|nr:hypothetical protein [Ruminococcus sp.]